VRNAWLSDDAYITFRTIDNFLNGYGLTWNVAERVQVYTHPLWMFLLSAVSFFTREVYFSSLGLSLLLSLVTLALVMARGARTLPGALLGAAALTLSKAFVDYSTSGLENPLTHLLFALFLLLALRRDLTPRLAFFLSLLAALGMTNRMDTALLFLPTLLAVGLRLRSWKGWAALAAGMVPFLLWEAFALFYYGFPYPNTAPAKMNVGLTPRADLLRQGVYYLLNSLRWDPLTLVLTVTGGVVAGLGAGRRRALPAIAGIVLYVAYTVWIGGDFMSGRFLTAPLLGAVILLLDGLRQPPRWLWLALFALTVGLGLGGPRTPVLTGCGRAVDRDPAQWVDVNRVADERANYHTNTNPLRLLEGARLPDHRWALDGQAARQAGPAVVEKGSIGFFGYFAGPQVHVVDLLGLGDPLLARLPPGDPRSGVGHLGRVVPDGYIETLESGENRIRDPNLAFYYDRLAFVTRGPLWDMGRLAEVWRFNVGAYDAYLDAYAFYRGAAFVQRLEVVNPTDHPYVFAYVWNNGAAEAFLLDDDSRRGASYTLQWTITAAGAEYDGPAIQQIAFGNPLADDETLNVGVFFSQSADHPTYAMFERRFWFRLEEDGGLTVTMPGMEWANPQAPEGMWVSEDIDAVLHDASQ
jgi:arabinofuranosyltransferase